MTKADKHGLMLFDNFNGQCTDRIFQLLEEPHISSVIISANCTDCLQPLDLSFSKAAKTFLYSKFRCGLLKKLLCKRMVKNQEKLWTYSLVT